MIRVIRGLSYRVIRVVCGLIQRVIRGRNPVAVVRGMFNLRTRVFVTVALVLAGATVASSLLSRRATLVEEREVFGPRRLPPLDGVDAEIQAAYGPRLAGDTDGAESDRHASRQPAPGAGSVESSGRRLFGGARIGQRGLGNP